MTTRAKAEARAWRAVALAVSEYTHSQHIAHGLCFAVRSLPRQEAGVKPRMLGRIRRHLDGAVWAYAEVYDPTLRAWTMMPHQEARVLAALWLAHEAEEDSR